MRQLPSALTPAGYSPNRLNPLSPARESDQGQRLTDLKAIQRLFANGESGGYWPADPAYLYEDSAGTIPATVNGVVGLRMDLSQNLNLGLNLFSNSEFNDNSSWTNASTGTGTFAISGGRASISGTSGSSRGAFNQASLTTGVFYKVYLKVSGISGTILAFGLSVGTGGFGVTTNKEINAIVFGGGNNGTNFYTINTGGSATFDSIYAYPILGNHAIQATTANKPYLRRTPISNKVWLDSNTATGELTATFSGSLGSACTVATVGAEGVTIAENQTVGTTYNLTPPYGYNGDILIINRLLTAAEKALVTRVMWRNVPTLGSNLTLNGAFSADTDWTKGTGWSITDVATKSAGTASNLTQNLGVSGNQYRVIADITRTAGTVGAYNGTAQIGATAATEMAAKYAMKTTSTTIGFRGDSSFAGTIDNAVIQDIL